MKAIYTYPDNPTTYYIDPNYVGSATSGYIRRISELKSGTYLGWWSGADTWLQNSDTDITLATGKYWRYIEDHKLSTNFQRYDIWYRPLVEFTPKSYNAEVTGIEVLNINGVAGLRLTGGFGQRIEDAEYAQGFNFTNQGNGLETGLLNSNYYLKKITGGTVELYSDVGLTTPYVPWNGANQDDFYLVNIDNQAYMIFDQTVEGYITDDTIVMAAEPTIGNAGNLEGSVGTTYVFEKMRTNVYRLWNDAGKTSPTGLFGQGNLSTEVTGPDISTAVGTYNIGVDLSDPSYASLRTELELKRTDTSYGQYYDGWCRVKVNNTGAGITFPGKTVTSTYDADRVFFYFYNNNTQFLNFYEQFENDWGNLTNLQVERTDSLGTVSFDMQIIDYINHNNEGGNFYNPRNELLDTPANLAGVASADTTPADSLLYINKKDKYGFWGDSVETWLPGVMNYTYKDASNVTQPGAQVPVDLMWKAGTNGLVPVYDVDPVFTVSLTGSNYYDGVNTSPTHAGQGVFDDGDQRVYYIDYLPSQYVPPAPTPEEIAEATALAEDNWNNLEQWAGTQGDSLTAWVGNPPRKWPAIPPKSAEITARSPSVSTVSQSGIKYARSGGYTKWGMDVEYPPLNYDDFTELFATSQIARGTVATFQFPLDPVSNNHFIWKGNFGKSTNFPRMVEKTDNDRRFLVDGYNSNESGVVAKGQLVQSGSTRNGESANLAIEAQNANVFGEVQFRLAYRPEKSTVNVGSFVWMTPNSVVVSLSEDNFKYTVGADGLYRVSVRFDLDFWK